MCTFALRAASEANIGPVVPGFRVYFLWWRRKDTSISIPGSLFLGYNITTQFPLLLSTSLKSMPITRVPVLALRRPRAAQCLKPHRQPPPTFFAIIFVAWLSIGSIGVIYRGVTGRVSRAAALANWKEITHNEDHSSWLCPHPRRFQWAGSPPCLFVDRIES